MSAFRGHMTGNRYDSALDLSHSGHSAYHDAQEDSESVTASSVVDPWSEYNTRLGDPRLTPYQPDGWFLDSRELDQRGPSGQSTQFLENIFTPADATFRYTSPEAATPTSCSESQTPPPRLSQGMSSSPDASSTAALANYHSAHIISCAQCNQTFSGTYRQGNLARHVREKHSEAPRGPYTCPADGCSRVYKRADARLKHARKRHPDLHLPPVQRRHGTEHCPPRHEARQEARLVQDLSYNVGQWSQGQDYLSDGQMPMIDPRAIASLLPQAHVVFGTLQAKLHYADYSRLCDSFFSRWETIVQQLADDKSDVHEVYAQVLDDLRGVVESLHSTTYPRRTAHAHSRAPHQQRPESRSAGSLRTGPATVINSSTDRVSKRGERHQASSIGSGSNARTALAKILNDSKGKKVDCPIHKHHIMHNTTPPCHGCCVGVMSQVRGHLNPGRAGTHGGFPEFLEQCSRCKQDFITSRSYNIHKNAHCEFRTQSRGDIVTPWVRQYLALYPHAPRVPLPWHDQVGWLPSAVVSLCRSASANTASSSSFLGVDQNQNSAQAQIAPSLVDPAVVPAYHTALHRMLLDAVDPQFILADGSSTATQNPDRHTQSNFQPGQINARFLDANPWAGILWGLAYQQRAMHRAAGVLEPWQTEILATQCAQMSNISRDIHQTNQALHHATHMSPIVPGPGFQSTQIGDTTLSTPAQSQIAPTADYTSFATPSPSTQPSSRSYATGSSHLQSSVQTGLSSLNDNFDPRFPNADSPTAHRGTSLPPGIVQDNVHLRRGRPSRRSLQYDADDLDDPSVVYSPSNENEGDPFDDVQRNLSRRW